MDVQRVLLENVFKLSGIPTYTFVPPSEYDRVLVALRTPGRGLVLEGPSGIGKTTAISKAIEDLGIGEKTLRLSARKSEDRELIAELPGMSDIGTVIVDDFHRLPLDHQGRVADFLKILADEERADSKVVVVGINRTGDSLVQLSKDLNTRISTIRFEANPESRVHALIDKGEEALNITLNTQAEIARTATGSFYLAQLLCHHTCIQAGITERQEQHRQVSVSLPAVIGHVLDDLNRRFFDVARNFAAGPKLRREGRAPYLHILKWLADSNEWSLFLSRELGQHPELRGSVGQVLEKGYLEGHFKNHGEFFDVLHYDARTQVLSVEDPQFVFYIRNLLWNKFARRVGFLNVHFDRRYDFALSFAGTDRRYAQGLFDDLVQCEFEVFYDKNEQHRILAEDVEDYLGPIYSSEAEYVVCLLGPDYPKRIWTKFESDQFRARFGEGAVIPIWFTSSAPGLFDESTRVGGISFDPSGNVDEQLHEIADQLRKKIAEDRNRQD